MSHARCGEPAPEVGAAPRGAGALNLGAVLARAPDALAFAAAPTFALLALSTAFAGGRSDMLRMSMPDGSPPNGMTLMCALMSAFHTAPWLNWISRR